jgi:hypothetical protein
LLHFDQAEHQNIISTQTAENLLKNKEIGENSYCLLLLKKRWIKADNDVKWSMISGKIPIRNIFMEFAPNVLKNIIRTFPIDAIQFWGGI